MCNDFLRLGYSNFVVDPGVRLAYDGGASRILYREHIVAAPATAWSDVLAVPIRGNSSAQQPLFQYANSHPCQHSQLPGDLLTPTVSHQPHARLPAQGHNTACGLQVLQRAPGCAAQ